MMIQTRKKQHTKENFTFASAMINSYLIRSFLSCWYTKQIQMLKIYLAPLLSCFLYFNFLVFHHCFCFVFAFYFCYVRLFRSQKDFCGCFEGNTMHTLNYNTDVFIKCGFEQPFWTIHYNLSGNTVGKLQTMKAWKSSVCHFLS